MEDLQIIDLYLCRNEAAIQETDTKYGRLLNSIALNILSNCEDSEECVNDTYCKAWNAIPPQKPKSLASYLGRIVRNLSINRWHKNRAQKRYNGAELLITELSDCIPTLGNVENEVEGKELSEVISDWLYTLSRDDRVLFLHRYWFGDPLNKLADECGTTPNKLAGRMYRLRQSLKSTLEKEGVLI
ncbi:sigma-70 family RNA polymerase sigma factor [Alkalicella caledoniensis]|uniref:Sigma-70 family RNA polymerase sigma factor n=1 Tax=Alkalicella caledoniensis TaxID=2731377 RepID=A0A7G9W6H7_ALKCA|nr:sigma-70 family RNA polymerase sigma factor [Alkalicella caledoniensis]QNO14289.1 sigma-70 family RNA polymerase sigma factor [Alkalicella caledoniensis]